MTTTRLSSVTSSSRIVLATVVLASAAAAAAVALTAQPSDEYLPVFSFDAAPPVALSSDPGASQPAPTLVSAVAATGRPAP